MLYKPGIYDVSFLKNMDEVWQDINTSQDLLFWKYILDYKCYEIANFLDWNARCFLLYVLQKPNMSTLFVFVSDLQWTETNYETSFLLLKSTVLTVDRINAV